MNLFIFMVNAIIQVIMFSVIPFFWWMITARDSGSFFRWIGLKPVKTEEKSKIISFFLLTIVILTIPAIFIIPNFVAQVDMATGMFLGKGFSALIPAIIYSFIMTGLSEEIFFRGFIAKRIISNLGLKVGNILQATLFGLLHGVMFWSIVGPFGSIIIIILTGTAGFMLAYINEKLADGSIIPSWFLHGCANLLASLIAMFNLL